MKTIGNVQMLTTGETARELGVTPKTIRNWCAEKGRPEKAPDLRPYRGPSDRLFFLKSHIDALREQWFGEAIVANTHSAAPN